MNAAIEVFINANSKERRAIAEVVKSLIPIMDEKLYVQEGYSSLFAFLTERCRYSEASAYRRIAAAPVVSLLNHKPSRSGMCSNHAPPCPTSFLLSNRSSL